MKALRSLLIYAVIGFAGYAYFSYEDWLDQASATMGGYESVENYREAQNMGVASRDEYLEKKQAIADKLKKEQEEKERLAKIEKEKKERLARLEKAEAAKKTKFLNENFPADKKYVYFTDGSCKPKAGSICIDQARAKFACDNLEKLGANGMYPFQERLLARNAATFRFGAEKQFIESASSSNGVFVWTSNFTKTFEACYAQITLTGMMNGSSKVMNIQGRACTFERKKNSSGKEYFSVEYFCS